MHRCDSCSLLRYTANFRVTHADDYQGNTTSDKPTVVNTTALESNTSYADESTLMETLTVLLAHP